MTGTTVRQAVFDLLRAEGVDALFGNPGSTELTFLRNWPNDIRYVFGLQEASVVAMADGYAQGTGQIAFINLHSAAGIGHSLGNLFTAFRNGTPMVVTAGQQARSLLPRAPYLFTERAMESPRPYVEWACEPARAEAHPGERAKVARQTPLALRAAVEVVEHHAGQAAGCQPPVVLDGPWKRHDAMPAYAAGRHGRPRWSKRTSGGLRTNEGLSSVMQLGTIIGPSV